MQLFPLLPQAELLTAVTHDPLLQQVLQLPGPQPPASTPPSTHTALWQLCPAPHCTHARALMPQACA
jgi:hypothetical protein